MPRIRPTVRGALLLAVAASSLALAAPSWGATTFTVTSTADSPDMNAADQQCISVVGGCTIRAAIEQSDNLIGSDDIVIPPGTYTLNLGQLQPDTPMNIIGTGGAKVTTLDLKGTSSGFNVDAAGPLTISGVAITNGGGVSSPFYVQGPDVTLTGVWIHDNVVTSANPHGAVYLFAGSLTILRSAITGNAANGSSFGIGGGIAVDGGNLVVEATTIARNSVKGGTGIGTGGFGGGISTLGQSVVLRHVTLVDNTATAGSVARGGNLYMQAPAGGGVAVADSIITGGAAFSEPDCAAASGALSITGRNVYANGAAPNCVFPPANTVAPPPVLTALGDHGGLNGSTAPPLAGSPAVDAAAACPVGGIDQRGTPAPTGAACDIGAAEAGADLQLSLATSASSVAAGGQITYVAKVVNGGFDDATSAGLIFTPPAGTSVLLVAPSQGSCDGTTCSLGTLAAGASASVTVVVGAPASGTLQASALTASTVPDPTPANATVASAVTSVVPAQGSGPNNPPPPPPDKTKPVLSAFGVKGPLKAGKSGRLRLTLTEAANVTIAVQSLTPGRRVKGKCDPKGKSGARCTITKSVGSLTVALPAGARLFTFPAKIGKSTLKAGRYRLTVSAKDAAGNSSKSLATDVTVAGTKAKPKK